MARQATRKDARANATGITDKQLRKIWSELPGQGFVEQLRRLQPHAKWSLSGHRISGCCPYHDDRTPSFQVYLDRGYAKCFGCGAFEWNPVSFWSHLTGANRTDALTDLRQTFRLSFLTAAAAATFTEYERHQALKARLMAIAHDTLMEAINTPEKCPAIMQDAVDWLINVRKLPLSAIPTFDMLGIMPQMGVVLDRLDAEAEIENMRLKKYAEENGGRMEYFQSYAEEAKVYLAPAASWVGSVVFRYDMAYGTPARFKIRRPNTGHFIFLADDYVQTLGFFGIGWNRYNQVLGSAQSQITGLHLVEGEFDALSLMGHQIEEFGGPQLVVVASGGSSTAEHVDDLYDAVGVEEVSLVGDAPDKGGDILIKGWLSNTKRLRARIFTGWQKFPGSGDPDEAVLQHGIKHVVPTLLDFRSPDIYRPPPDWVLDQAAPELLAIEERDVRQRVEIATGWGRLLNNSVESDTYVDLCAKHYGLPPGVLKRQIVALEEDQPAFVQRLADTLLKEFFVVGQEVGESSRVLVLWHRERRNLVRVVLGDERSIEREMGAIFGPLYQFFMDRVGVPAFMQWENTEGAYLQKFDADCRFFAKQAFMSLAQNAVEIGTNKKGQGVHVIRGPNPEVYLVNGRDVYYGYYEGDDLRWEALPGPAHKGIIFDVGFQGPAESWLRTVKTTEDLCRATKIDLHDAYKRLYAMLDVGWRFKHHQTTVKFLAAHLVAATACSAFKRQTVLGIHAESQSGKSRLLTGLLTGTGAANIQVISAALGMDGYSSAGVRQLVSNKTRALVLDEFEHEGNQDKKGRAVNEIMEMLRNLTGEVNTFYVGSRNGTPVAHTLSMFVFTASITKPTKVQDANRMLSIEMIKADGFDDPKDTLPKIFGDAYISQLRDDLEVALLPHIKRTQYEYAEVSKYYSRAENRPAGMETRMLEAMYPALTVLRVVGEDAYALAKDFCDVRTFDMVRTSEQSESAGLMSWIMASPQIQVRSSVTGDIYKTDMLALLADPVRRKDINTMGTGMYFDEVQSLLVVNWTQAVQTVLRLHPKYSRDTNMTNIRDTANRHETALTPMELQNCGVLQRLSRFGLGAVPVNTLSAFRVAKVLQSFEVQEPAPPKLAPNQVTINLDETNETPDYYGTKM